MRIEFAWNHNLCNYCLLIISVSSSKQCVGQNGGVLILLEKVACFYNN